MRAPTSVLKNWVNLKKRPLQPKHVVHQTLTGRRPPHQPVHVLHWTLAGTIEAPEIQEPDTLDSLQDGVHQMTNGTAVITVTSTTSSADENP